MDDAGGTGGLFGNGLHGDIGRAYPATVPVRPFRLNYPRNHGYRA